MENILEFVFIHRQEIFIIVLASFLGIEVIAHVPSVLHTPLMSGANAVSGVIIIGGIILLGHADMSKLAQPNFDHRHYRCFLCHAECRRWFCGY